MKSNLLHDKGACTDHSCLPREFRGAKSGWSEAGPEDQPLLGSRAPGRAALDSINRRISCSA